METIIDMLQAFQFNTLEGMVAGLFIFLIGFQFGNRRVKKLNHQIYSLQREVLDLNAELLYGKDESETPVIEIKHESLKNNKIAK